LVWKERGAVVDASGLRLFATHAFNEAPPTEILFVPGGPGQLALMDDVETLTFLRQRAEQAKFVTSVCTGSLVLAAAGLLQGYHATCHWMSLSQLALMGSVPVQERVVVDRNRVTGAGVTSGIDFALTLVARIFGDERARLIQLSMEYDPHPPFPVGSVAKAEPGHVEQLKAQAAGFQQQRDRAARLAGELLKLR
jgi:cyclohexyl-isocyanide hydratase